MGACYFVVSPLVLRGFTDLEQREAIRNTERVYDELNHQANEIHQNASDWSNWDDAYRFINDRNGNFISSNLSTVWLNLDVMAFLDTQGNIVQTCFPQKSKRKKNVAEDLRHALGFDRSTGLKTKELSGIICLKDGTPMMVSVRPIVHTSGTGPSRGWTVFALELDNAQARKLSSRLHVEASLFDGATAGEAGHYLKRNKGVFTKPQSESVISGYYVLRDVFGQPAKILRVSDQRSMYAQGKRVGLFLQQMLLAAGTVLSIVILLVLEFGTLSRVSNLTSQVEQLSLDSELQKKIALSGKDELSYLAKRIDEMVSCIRLTETKLRSNNAELNDSVSRLAAANHVMANAVEGIAEFDSEGRIIAFNSSFTGAHGYEGNTLMGKHWETVVDPRDHDIVRDAMQKMIENRKASFEIRGLRIDGTSFHEEIVMVAALDANQNRFRSYWFVKDISERKRLEAQIEYQAYHDPLTGLPNRTLFINRLRVVHRKARDTHAGIALLFIDLDDFKNVNDTYGHEIGDQLLSGIAKRIEKSIRPQDMAARLGGDEFTVLLDGIESAEAAALISKRILQSLETSITTTGGEIRAGASIGITYSGDASKSAEALLNESDLAMYEAKRTKRAGRTNRENPAA